MAHAILRASLFGEEAERQVEIRLSRDGKKEIRVDKVRVERLSDMMERFYVVVFSPEDLKIVKEEPEKRRSFMDRELCRLSLSYLSHLVAYKKTLMQRNALLRTGNPDRESLFVWDDALAAHGAQLVHRRARFLEEISGISSGIHSQITQGKETLELSYQPSVPPAAMPGVIAAIEEVAARRGVVIGTFGHAGDGNLHPTILTDKRDKEEFHRVELAVDEIFDVALSLGGTLSGEHGIGTAKSKWLEKETSKATIIYSRRLKKAVDPNYLLNPGKIIGG